MKTNQKVASIAPKLYKTVLAPIVSEKTTNMADVNGQYAFRVVPNATKLEIKRAVEALFNVEVEKVQVLNIKGKQKRFKQRLGKRSDIRKAYVKLKQGFEIEFFGKE